MPNSDAPDDNSVGLTPIVLSEIKKMTDLYRSTMPSGDAISAWVAKDDIDLLILQNPGSNGIRLYYGRHADDAAPDFGNKHNVILVATKGPNVAGEKLSSENSVDQLNDDLANGTVNNAITDFSGNGGDAVPLCPPHCPPPPSALN